MDATAPLIDMVRDFMVLEPAHRFPPRGKKHLACLNVPVRDAVVTATHGELPPFFAGSERFFDLLALGDVEDGPSDAEGVAGRIRPTSPRTWMNRTSPLGRTMRHSIS